MKPSGYVLYRGPSLLDGAPIVVIAITKSSNRKTGDMLQTYILRDDMKPTDALRSGADASICGDCKHRPVLGGACYVRVDQGPLVVWKAYKRGIYPYRPAAGAIEALGIGRMVRLGTYGDPAAVPVHVWESLTRHAKGRTGYTHQWLNPALPSAHLDALARLCMASVDGPEEADFARGAGYRYFRIRTAAQPLAAREFICPASDEAGKRKTCAECRACDGTAPGKERGASPVIIAHGAKARRFIPLVVSSHP